jgi:1-phosphofructokinase
VFAPALFLTVTLERRGDDDELHLHSGGQGLWIARMLATLGVDVVLCGPFGGEIGLVVKTLVEQEGITLEAVDVESTSGAYLHDRRAGAREVVADLPPQALSRHEIDELYGAAVVAARAAPVTVLGGPHAPSPVPPDVYRRLASDVGGGDRLVVADLSGESLEAALAGGVDVLKAAHDDLARDGHARSIDSGDLVIAAHTLRDAGAANVVVSRAEEPALLLAGDELYEIHAPTLEPADAAGAGDSMTAGIVAGLVAGATIVDAARLGAAAGALNATRHGKGSGQRNQIQRLAREVTARPLADAPADHPRA